VNPTCTTSSKNMAGAFITFEGIDGCGKSTQLRLLASELRVRGVTVVTTREPGGTPLGQRLRAALLDVQEQVDPLAELLVFAADRAQHVRKHLRPSLAANQVVLSDRYADATVAYQGAGRGFAPELIQEIVQLATEGLRPDLTLLFDLSVAESAVRTRRRVENKRTDRLDSEDAEFHTRVRNAYVEIAKAEPARIKVIDARGSVQETHLAVMDIVMPFLKERGLLGAEQSARSKVPRG
jgi:dTMP kinase